MENNFKTIQKLIEDLKPLAESYSAQREKKLKELNIKNNVLELKKFMLSIEDSRYFNYKKNGAFLSWDGNNIMLKIPEIDTNIIMNDDLSISNIPYEYIVNMESLMREFLNNVKAELKKTLENKKI